MTWHGLRIPVVAVVLVLTLAVLLGGTYVYRRQTETSPLTRQSAAVEGVLAVATGRNGAVTELKVDLAAVADLRQTYRTLEGVAEGFVPRERLRLVLADRRTPELEALYHRVHYLVYEAAVRGTYSQLGQVEVMLSGEERLARVTVDERFVYVQIHDRDGAYLYELVPLARTGGGDPS